MRSLFGNLHTPSTFSSMSRQPPRRGSALAVHRAVAATADARAGGIDQNVTLGRRGGQGRGAVRRKDLVPWPPGRGGRRKSGKPCAEAGDGSINPSGIHKLADHAGHSANRLLIRR